MLGVALGAGGCAASALMAYAVRGRSSTLFGPSVYRGDPGRRAVALTFDDGPSESTPALLDVLARHDARATFFQCGVNVERLPRVAQQVRDAGHEIGNHSHTHPYFLFKGQDFIEREFVRAQDVISSATGVVPRLLRAPFGVRWFGFAPVQRKLDLLGVMWTVLGRDWKLPGAAVLRRIQRSAGNGCIICLHDGREARIRPDIRETVIAVERLLPLLREQGYRFETVSQILCPTN
jgi:peptidoglycan-N-acetylglucosamine deacetylase